MDKVVKRMAYLCLCMLLIFIISTPAYSAKNILGPKITVAAGYDPDIALDAKGALHVAYIKGSSTYYRKINAPYTAGKMGPELYVGNGGNPQIALDSTGNPHIVFGRAHYSYLNGSSFSDPVQAFSGWRKNLIAVDSKDRVYIIADRYSPRSVLVRVYQNGKALNAPQKVGDDNPGGVDVDSNDTLHLTWRAGYTYYNTYTYGPESGKGPSVKFPQFAGDFSWCSVDRLDNSVHVVATAAYAKGINYYAKEEGGRWSDAMLSATAEAYVHEPDYVNPVSTVDAQGYTYLTFRGKGGVGYFAVIDDKNKMLGEIMLLDPENSSSAGGKMTNPNVISSSTTKGAYVAWGTSYVYVRSIGIGGIAGPTSNLPVMQLLLNQKAVKTREATDITNSTATLNGVVQPKGKKTTVEFQWGTDALLTSYTSVDISGIFDGYEATSVSAHLGTLAQGETYYFRLAGQNKLGVIKGNILRFSTDDIPSVKEVGASSVNSDKATLNGIINPNGDETTVTFEWGISGTLPFINIETLTGGPLNGNGDIPCTLNLEGLTPGETYYFRVLAENSLGVAASDVLSFTTYDIDQPAVYADPADVTSTGAVLNGRVNPNGAETTVVFDVGFTPGDYIISLDAEQSPLVELSTEQDVTYTVSFDSLGFLVSGTKVFYRIVANNGIGGDGDGNVFSEEVSFTTN